MLIEAGPASEFDANAILAGLNGSFPRWGDERFYDWAFRRVVAGRAPDLIVARKGNRIVASMALMYRRVVGADGMHVLAALAGGAWTAPEERQHGIFQSLLERSVDLADARGAALITGMGRDENVSRRSFDRLGFGILRSAYCRSREPQIVEHEPVGVFDPHPSLFPPPDGVTRYVYSEEEWFSQFVNRPEPVECIGRDGEWAALIERVDGFDRVLALHAVSPSLHADAIDVLASRAHAAHRRLFLFSADAGEAARLAGRGFEAISGYVPLRPSVGFTNWWMQHGDRA